MARVTVKKNITGIEAVLSSPEVQADLMERAQRIKAAADSVGSGKYQITVRPGKKGGRPYVVVHVPEGDWQTYGSNKKHNTLRNALSAGR
jgi:hypothetical protein